MTAVLLLGASGFVGGHVRRLLAADPRCTRLACAGRDRIDLLAATAEDYAALLRAEAPDVVLTCTGRLDGTAAQLLAANTLVPARLADAVAAAAPGARLVRVGSAGEYGPMPHGRAVTEDHPARPAGAYGLSHATATRALELASAGGGVDGITLRVFNPIGPGLGEETLLGRAAARLRSAIADGAGSVVLGPLGAHRDFVDVRDVAAALVAAAFAPATALASVPGRVLNVGSGHAVTCREAVAALAAEAGFRGVIEEAAGGPHPGDRGAGRSAAVDWSCADVTRARDVLGWVPRWSLAESVAGIWAGTAEPAPAGAGSTGATPAGAGSAGATPAGAGSAGAGSTCAGPTGAGTRAVPVRA